MIIRALIAMLLAAELAACTTAQPKQQTSGRCDLPRTPLRIDLDAAGEAATSGAVAESPAAPSAGNVYLNAFRTARTGAPVEGPDQPLRQLVLSGGGQHGSFSVGFLNGLERYPGYDIVTGVSTGALQSPFALLGKIERTHDLDADAGKDDILPDKIPGGRPYLDDLVAGYRISRENALYNKKGDVSVVRKARYGDLKPLRRRTKILVSDDTIAALAALRVRRQSEGRNAQLLIALLNWNSGDTELVDMMALAERFALAHSPDSKELVRECFVEVMIAAGSEPLGAEGVLIDGNLYFDAGLRYGVFSRYLDEAVRAYTHERQPPRGRGVKPLEVVTDVIRNGQPDIGAFNDKKFSALDIANRGRKILVSQVYGFSVKTITDGASDAHCVRLAYIRDGEMAAGPPKEKAVFDPDYMERMINVGTNRRGEWDDQFRGAQKCPKV